MSLLRNEPHYFDDDNNNNTKVEKEDHFYYLSSLVFRWNQPGDYFDVKTNAVSALFAHSNASELCQKVSKYVKDDI